MKFLAIIIQSLSFLIYSDKRINIWRVNKCFQYFYLSICQESIGIFNFSILLTFYQFTDDRCDFIRALRFPFLLFYQTNYLCRQF